MLLILRPVGREAAARETVRREAAARETVGREAAARETVGREAAARETVGREAAARETVGREAAARETVGREAAARETVGREAAARETVGREAAARETVGREAAANETVRRGAVPAAVVALVATSAMLAGCHSSEPAAQPLPNTDGGLQAGPDASPTPDAGASTADASGDASGGTSSFQCPVDRTWTTIASHAWLASVRRFGGITPDELRVAWTSDTGAVSFAMRSKRNEDFGPPTIIPTETTPIADDRVALGADGITIVAVAADRASFVGLGLQGTTWGPIPAAQFGNLNAMAVDTQAQFFEPVLGADGTSFYYVLVPGAPNPGLPALYRSSWDPQAHAWASGVRLTNAELTAADATHRRRATGSSLDGLTLFFFDEVQGTERAAWRASTTAPYSQFHDLASFPEAAPSVNCDRLYFQQGPAILSQQ